LLLNTALLASYIHKIVQDDRKIMNDELETTWKWLWNILNYCLYEMWLGTQGVGSMREEHVSQSTSSYRSHQCISIKFGLPMFFNYLCIPSPSVSLDNQEYTVFAATFNIYRLSPPSAT
jgi:hypothetical protein